MATLYVCRLTVLAVGVVLVAQRPVAALHVLGEVAVLLGLAEEVGMAR